MPNITSFDIYLHFIYVLEELSFYHIVKNNEIDKENNNTFSIE